MVSIQWPLRRWARMRSSRQGILGIGRHDAERRSAGHVRGDASLRYLIAELHLPTVVWIKQDSRRKYWATRSSIRSFTCTAHSFACPELLALLAPYAGLTHLLARYLRSLPRSWESELLMSQNDLVLSHSAPPWLAAGLPSSHVPSSNGGST